MTPCVKHDWETHGQPALRSCNRCGKVWSDPLPTYGMLGTAPCGHPGMAVIGHYYTCLKGCDAIPEPVDPEVTEEHEDADSGDESGDAGWYSPSMVPWTRKP